MGNCSLKGVVTTKSTPKSIRIMTDSGDVLELEGPKLVEEVVTGFPGYGIFRQCRVSSPLSHQEELVNGHVYYLLQVEKQVVKDLGTNENCVKDLTAKKLDEVEQIKKQKKALGIDADLNDLNANRLNEVEPVRVSSAASYIVTNLANGSGLEVLAPPQKGVWRVKLAINTKQLEEILAEEVNTEALIEQMRMAAAASGQVTPRRTKSYWGVSLRPILCNVFKVPTNLHQENVDEAIDLCISSPIKGS